MATNNVKAELSADGRTLTFTVDMSNPESFGLTSKGKSHLAASAGWTKGDGDLDGLSFTLAAVLSFDAAKRLAEMQKPATPAKRTRKQPATPASDAGDAQAA